VANQKVVLLVGAGATVADVASRSLKSRPPLDKGFFHTARKYRAASRIIAYMNDVYDVDITDREYDSLEKIMAWLYADVFDPTLRKRATEVFRDLISLFNRRLAETTNSIVPTKKRFLYRIIIHYFSKGFDPADLSIITFNQDLQIEKILHRLKNTNCWDDIGNIFTFPSCYRLAIKSDFITSPSQSSRNLFDVDSIEQLQGIQVLKLHGSLNWYSTHRSTRVSPEAMFRTDRQIWITRRQSIEPTMKLTGGHRTQHTLPVVVPPVTHKSGILHRRVRKIWNYAEEALVNANDIVIFGYSCPALDFESSNLIQRSWRRNKKCKKISIIDPDSSVLKRYVDLITPENVCYYPSAKYFFEA
jgi:hypothetical protein